MQSRAKTAKDYLDELPDDRRNALSKLRTLIRKAAPAATEGMEYGMITYSMGELLFGLAAQKGYMAIYVCDTAVVDVHRQRLGKLNCGKGCIRFKKLDDLPLDAVTDILREAFQQRKEMHDKVSAGTSDSTSHARKSLTGSKVPRNASVAGKPSQSVRALA